MKDVFLPSGPAEHHEWLLDLIGPLANVAHWRRLCAQLVDQRAPLGYTTTEVGEQGNLSIWFGLLDLRTGRYADTPDGRLTAQLYVAHELAHLLTATPLSAHRDRFAVAFDVNESLASYETELRVYDDVPELLDLSPFSPLLASYLLERGWDLTNAVQLVGWRSVAGWDPDLITELPGEAARMRSYGDNYGWAAGFWDTLDRIGWFSNAIGVDAESFNASDYRQRLAGRPDRPTVSQSAWETTLGWNMTRAARLCGVDLAPVSDRAAAGDVADTLTGLPFASPATPTRKVSR